MLRHLTFTVLFILSAAAARAALALPQEPDASAAPDASSDGSNDGEAEAAEAAPAPRLTTEGDWGQWERLGPNVLSPMAAGSPIQSAETTAPASFDCA